MKINFMRLPFLTIILFASASPAIEKECVEWFKKGKVDSSAKDCELRCSVLPADINTFFCNNHCDEFCRPLKHDSCAEAKKKWESILMTGRPADWEQKTEKTKSWTADEKSKVSSALLKIPEKLSRRADFKIFRMAKPFAKGNLAAYRDGSLVLYDEAFEEKKFPLERVIAHELAHLFYEKMIPDLRRSFSVAAEWFTRNRMLVPGRKSSDYVAEDGENSVEEDFANNMEFEIYDLQRLLEKSRPIHNWINQNFGDSFKKGESCEQK